MTPDEIQAVEEDFRARLEAGQAPDLEEVVLAHPAASAELHRRLTAVAALHAVAFHLPVIDGYTVLEPLGSGGEADVYRATVTRSQLVVAVKVFRGGHPARFQREVLALTKLIHPYIVQLLDNGITADGRPYLSMPLFPLGSLDRRFPTANSLAPPAIAELMAQVADAAHAAHQKDIIHRDIKPSNVLIDDNGFPRLSDFGLALVADETAVTKSGDVIGTYLFMAPEQAGGKCHDATKSTDVYGLGTVLYWLLTGRPPFAPAPLGELLRRVMTVPPPPPRTVNPSAPPGLAVICLKCLEKSPADRYPSAAAVADDLRGWLAGKVPRGPGLWECVRKWWRRRSPAFRAVVVASSVILAVLAASGLWVRSANQETRIAETVAAAMAQARAQVTVRTALDRGWQLLRAKQAGWTPKLRADLAEVYRESRDLPDDDRETARLEARSLYAMSLAWIDIEPVSDGRLDMTLSNFAAWPAVPHPDGKWIAVGTPQGPFRFQPGEAPMKPEGLAAPPSGQRMPRLAYRPDGEVLAFAPATGGLQLWDGTVSRKLADLDAGGPPVLAVGFAPGVIRACRADGRVISWGLGGWGKLSVSAGDLTAARFTPDATRLAVGDKTGQVRELTADGLPVPDRKWVAPGVRTEVQALAWKPDGSTPAAGFKEGVVIAWNAAGVVEHRFAAFSLGVDRLDFSPSGLSLVAASQSERGVVWDVTSGEMLVNGATGIGGFSRDGRTVSLSQNREVALGSVTGPSHIRPLLGHRAPVRQLAWSADGRRLATLDVRWDIRVWEAETGRMLDHFDAPVGEFFAGNAGLALSPDGRFLAYACGGPPGTKGAALIWDTTARAAVARWENPPGFDRLAWESGNRFLLVREEFVGGTQNLQTVVRRLEPERPPAEARVLRQSQPTDTRRYLEAILTPDGRYYAWLGPRDPKNRRRIEIWDTATEKPVFTRPVVRLGDSEPGLDLDPTGRLIQIGDDAPQVIELPTDAHPHVRVHPPSRWTEDRKWIIAAVDRRGQNGRAVQIVPAGTTRPLFELPGGELAPDCNWGTGGYGFRVSPDDRRIVWCIASGLQLIADMPNLERAVLAFEAEHIR